MFPHYNHYSHNNRVCNNQIAVYYLLLVRITVTANYCCRLSSMGRRMSVGLSV